MATGYFTHDSCALHAMGERHPEAPERLAAIADCLRASGVSAELDHRDAELVTREDLLRAHPESHLDALESLSPGHGLAWVDPDTALNSWTLAAAGHAAGAVSGAVRAVLRGELGNAFCAVRPPGHHAERASPMGFCFYNSIAVGALVALAEGLDRVAIVDFDVHHGNGTVDIFKDDERVLVCSSFSIRSIRTVCTTWTDRISSTRLSLRARGVPSIAGGSSTTGCAGWTRTARSCCWSRRVSTRTRAIRSADSSCTRRTSAGSRS
jgi:acetoin utilization deacetylase AcuC-like enzyme